MTQSRAEQLLEGFKLGSLGVSKKPKITSVGTDTEVDEPQKQKVQGSKSPEDRSFAADPNAFTTAFNKWMEIAKQRVEGPYKGSSLGLPQLSVEKGKRYWKILVKTPQTSVFAFIDTQNGNAYKPAGSKAPAKHARGNIFDPDHGAKWIGPYGMGYLR